MTQFIESFGEESTVSQPRISLFSPVILDDEKRIEESTVESRWYANKANG
jgi:hypothetical protein